METTSSSTFPISVTSELGKNISVPVSLDDTVLDLNMKLFAMDSCFYPSQSRLVHDGQWLMNEQTLRHYNITSNSIIKHLLRSRGGGSAALEGKEDVSVRGGGSAELEGKEDVSATDNQERKLVYQADSSRSASMVILHGGSAHADLTIETKSLLAGITSTSVEELQKRPQSDVPAQERSCRCVRQELLQVMPEIDSDILKEQNIYKACLPGPGIFQCSETGLAFEVESAASIVYRYADWSTYLKEADQNLWEPAGPLFNIWALPGTVRAVYLPHFICVSDVDTSGCSIAHFEFEKMTIQQPKKVMAFTAVLENPSFSLLGVVWRKLRSAISLPVHPLVLIFRQLSAANTTLHLYLIPDDTSVRQAIERREMSWNSSLIPKPSPFRHLFFGYRYKVSSKPKVQIKPEPHLPFCYKSPKKQQFFVEIYIKKMAEEIELFISDGQNDTVVWEASLRSDDFCVYTSIDMMPSDADFLKKHKTELCSRMGQISSILLHLRDEGVINSKEEEEVRAQNTKQEKNQYLLDLVEKKGQRAQEKLFQVLKKIDPFLVDDLDGLC